MRRLGAIAGLAPAAVAGLLVDVLGGLDGRSAAESAVLLTGIAASAVAVGWLVGPIVSGSRGTAIRGVIGYALLAGFVYLVVGSILGAWTGWPGGANPDLRERAVRFAGQLAYGLLYLPVWMTFTSPLAVAWVIALRALRSRSGLDGQPEARTVRHPRGGPWLVTRPVRIAIATAAIVVGYGLFVALLPLGLDGEPRPPWWLERPAALFALFSVPGVLAAIGAVRGNRPVVAAGGVLCLLQAFVAFSGVTIGFVVPGLLLIALAGSSPWQETHPISRPMAAAGVAAALLTIGAWVALLGMTSPRCYVAIRGGNGAWSATEVPATEQRLYGPMLIEGDQAGCSSAELTGSGMAVAAALAVGAVGVALRGPSAGRTPSPA